MQDPIFKKHHRNKQAQMNHFENSDAVTEEIRGKRKNGMT